MTAVLEIAGFLFKPSLLNRYPLLSFSPFVPWGQKYPGQAQCSCSNAASFGRNLTSKVINRPWPDTIFTDNNFWLINSSLTFPSQQRRGSHLSWRRLLWRVWHWYQWLTNAAVCFVTVDVRLATVGVCGGLWGTIIVWLFLLNVCEIKQVQWWEVLTLENDMVVTAAGRVTLFCTDLSKRL